MGLLDLVQRKTPVERAKKQLLEPYAQPEVRRGAVDKLFDIGTPEAYGALVQRFTFSANGQISDEAEKRELLERLTLVGAPVVAPLKAFVRGGKSITFALRALLEILDPQEGLAFCLETLESHPAGDHRTSQAKMALVTTIADVGNADSAVRLLPYLHDHADDVQFQTVLALEQIGDERICKGVCDVCTSDLHASRVLRRAAELLAKKEWVVRDDFPRFVDELRETYGVSKTGHLVPRSATS
jgi:HEAT repeat protein